MIVAHPRRLPVKLRSAAPFCLLLVLPACASVPAPKGEMANADLALRKAEAVNAAEVDPLDARLARDKLEKARSALSDGDNLHARRLAEQAEVDALVAEARARATRAGNAADEIREQIATIRSEAERASERIR
jgi:Domain of unknown function (DUF4398)